MYAISYHRILIPFSERVSESVIERSVEQSQKEGLVPFCTSEVASGAQQEIGCVTDLTQMRRFRVEEDVRMARG